MNEEWQSTIKTEPEPEVAEKAARGEPFWDYKDLLTILGLSFASFMFLAAALRAVLWVLPVLDHFRPQVGLLVQALLYVLVYFVFQITFATRYRQPVFRSLGWRPAAMPLWLAVTIGLTLPFAISGLAALLHAPKVLTPIDDFSATTTLLVMFAIFAVTLGPLFEELLFRGFIQPLFAKTFGVLASVLLSAAIFGALHGPEYKGAWQYMVILTVAGAVFGAMRAATNSIVPSLLAHSSFNLVMFMAFVFTRSHAGLSS